MAKRKSSPKEPIAWGEYGFTFMPSYYEATKGLPEENRKLLRDAIVEYAFTGKRISLPGMLDSCLTLMIPNIEASIRHYQDGNKGGRPPKPKNSEEDDDLPY